MHPQLGTSASAWAMGAGSGLPFRSAVAQRRQPLARLQRTYGNQAVLRMLRGQSIQPKLAISEPGDALGQESDWVADRISARDREAAPGASGDFSKITVLPPDRSNQPDAISLLTAPPLLGAIQPRLVVGQVDEPFTSASKKPALVLRGDAGAGPVSSASVASARREVRIALPAQERARWTVGPHPAAVSMLGAGRPLTPSERQAFPGWNDALGDVRIHDDRGAQVVAGLLGDAGFAAGHHVVLGHRVGPSTRPDRLLAHELTHVMQQRAEAPRAPSPDPEREAERFADLATRSDRSVTDARPDAAPLGLAERVIARYTQDLPNDLLLVVDVDDGDFVGGCVRAIVPHIGAKLIMKGVPKVAGNQLFDIHMGVTTNTAGETCFFFYESVSGLCDMTCFATIEELKQRLAEIRDWLKEKIEQVLRVLLPAAAATLLAYLIADALVGALAGAGILVLA